MKFFAVFFLIFSMPIFLQSAERESVQAIPVQPSVLFECPENFESDKRILETGLQKQGMPFFEEIFDILACLIEKRLVKFFHSPPSSFFLTDKSVQEARSWYEHNLVSRLYGHMTFPCTKMSEVDSVEYLDLLKERLQELFVVQLEKLSELIVLKTEPNSKTRRFDLQFDVDPFCRYMNQKMDRVEEKSSSCSAIAVQNLKPTPCPEPRPFVTKKELKSMQSLALRLLATVGLPLNQLEREQFIVAISQKLQQLLEILPDTIFEPTLQNSRAIDKKMIQGINKKKQDLCRGLIVAMGRAAFLHLARTHDVCLKCDLNQEQEFDWKCAMDFTLVAIQKMPIESMYQQINNIRDIDRVFLQTHDVQARTELDERKNKKKILKFELFEEVEQDVRKILEQGAQKEIVLLENVHNLQLQETQQREKYEPEIYDQQNNLLTEENFVQFCERLKIEKCNHELLIQKQNEDIVSQIEALAIDYEKELQIFDQGFETWVNSSKIAQILQRCLQAKKSETVVHGKGQSLAAKLKLRLLDRVRSQNGRYSQTANDRRSQRESAEEQLQKKNLATFQKSSQVWKSEMLALEKQLSQFDQSFDNWQKAIVLVQRFLQEKKTDVQKQKSVASYDAWMVALRQNLNNHQNGVAQVAQDFDSFAQKTIAEIQEKKSQRCVQATFWGKLLKFTEQKKQERLLAQQAERTQAVQVAPAADKRQNNPYAVSVISQQDRNQDQEPQRLNQPPVSNYFYWTYNGRDYAQDEFGFQYVWSPNSQRWEPLTQARMYPDPQALPAPVAQLQQAQANGWPVATEQEWQKILDLNEKIAKTNDYLKKRNERIAAGLELPPPPFLN